MQFVQHCWVKFEYIIQIIWVVTMPISIEGKKEKEKRNVTRNIHCIDTMVL